MSYVTIRVSTRTHDKLKRLKEERQSYDQLIENLIDKMVLLSKMKITEPIVGKR